MNDRLWLVAGLLICVVCPGRARAQDEKPDVPAAESRLRPAAPQPVPPAELEESLGRGVDYLVTHQNRDGSWGSPALKGGVPIIAGIGSHHAYQVAVTAMSVAALIESGSTSTAVLDAIEKGEKHLMEQLPRVRRDDPMLIYNVWTHAYGIQALVRMHARLPNDEPRRQRIRELIQGQYEKLTRYESVEGGWGYYDFDSGTQRPAASSTSFVNAAVLIALHESAQIGVAPPEKVVRRAVQMTKKERLPDGSYMYGYYLHRVPTHPVNQPGGSLGRSQACSLSLRLWGDKDMTDEVLETWLDRLISRNGWLSMGRKKPVPHESFYAVAGYFFYFGHYYAGLCIDQLPAPRQEFYKHHLARLIIDLQEADGSWFDYPFYDYHKAYGTAFAVMTLNACRAKPQWHLAPAQEPLQPPKN
ncbi:MAG: terpene cyclase/mutase family protein [Planctomycetes bacterium]|nr:terpene cyclase/mutase family protein [Planctomycetota bacterium]